ncbi:hypothetical protein NKG05_05780 [Oerskovia sp. M15]
MHGGYWDASYDRSLESAVARDLTDDGVVVWNLDYRGVGAPDPADEGGWPGTFEDVAAGLDLLPMRSGGGSRARARGRRRALRGRDHGLVARLACHPARRRPGASPLVRPDLVVTQAGVDDLEAAASAPGRKGRSERSWAAPRRGRRRPVPTRVSLGAPTARGTDVRRDGRRGRRGAAVGLDRLCRGRTGGWGRRRAGRAPRRYARGAPRPRSASWGAVRAWLAERGLGT